MEKALVDRRQLAEKYKEARDKLKELEQKPAVVRRKRLNAKNIKKKVIVFIILNSAKSMENGN